MPDPVRDLVRLVRQRLADLADPARAEPMRAYMKSSMPYRWALRQHARVDPEWVRAFVAEHEPRLSGLSRREAVKHL